MGDYFHVVGDRDVSLKAAPELAARVRDWLIAEAIILPQLFSGVVYNGGRDTSGYLPGPRVARALEDAGQAQELLETARYRVDGLIDLTAPSVEDGDVKEQELIYPYGLRIAIEHDCFNRPQDGFGFPTALSCPTCRRRVYEHWAPARANLVSRDTMWQATRDWLDGGVGALRCPLCQGTAPISEWAFDPPYAFGNLGFQFWNWTWLSDAFVAELGRKLGHRVVGVRCHS